MFGMQTFHLGSAAKHWKLAGWTYTWPKAQKVKEGFLMTFTSVLPGCSFQASGGKKSKILDLHSIIHLTLLFLFCCSICVFNVPSHTNTSTVPNFLRFFLHELSFQYIMQVVRLILPFTVSRKILQSLFTKKQWCKLRTHLKCHLNDVFY